YSIAMSELAVLCANTNLPYGELAFATAEELAAHRDGVGRLAASGGYDGFELTPTAGLEEYAFNPPGRAHAAPEEFAERMRQLQSLDVRLVRQMPANWLPTYDVSVTLNGLIRPSLERAHRIGSVIQRHSPVFRRLPALAALDQPSDLPAVLRSITEIAGGGQPVYAPLNPEMFMACGFERPESASVREVSARLESAGVSGLVVDAYELLRPGSGADGRSYELPVDRILTSMEQPSFDILPVRSIRLTLGQRRLGSSAHMEGGEVVRDCAEESFEELGLLHEAPREFADTAAGEIVMRAAAVWRQQHPSGQGSGRYYKPPVLPVTLDVPHSSLSKLAKEVRLTSRQIESSSDAMVTARLTDHIRLLLDPIIAR
ncbi:MAG: hypothetical protein ACRER5_17230, partial [Pseudomonas sp.]